MLDIDKTKLLAESFDWFLKVGATDAKQIRDE